jgi:fructose transport system permease protein
MTDAATLSIDESDNAFVHRTGPIAAMQHALHRFPTISPLFVLVVSWIALALAAERGNFATWGSTSTILKQTAVLGTVAVAQTLIVLTAGIDLSVGTGMLFTHLVVAKVFAEQGWNPWLAFALGAAIGALLGLFHGFLVTKVALPPFIVTLGTFYIFQSLGFVYSEAQTIAKEAIGGQSAQGGLLWAGRALKVSSMTLFVMVLVALALYAMVIVVGHLRRPDGQTSLLRRLVPALVPAGLVLFGLYGWPGKAFRNGQLDIINGVPVMFGLYLLVWLVLTNTAWGTHVYATGDDKEAARLAGINVNRVLVSVYVVAGLIYAFGGWVQLGRALSASANSAQDINLESITAVVIGGTSLFGGRGRIWGTLIGALIVSVFRLGLKLAGVDVYYQTFAIGSLIIIAVALDQWIRTVAK